MPTVSYISLTIMELCTMYVAVRSAIIVWMFIYPHQNVKSLDLYGLPSSAGLVIRIMLHRSCGVTLTCFYLYFGQH